jgi:ribonuclease P protein component
VVSAHFGRERRLTDSRQFSRVFERSFRSADRYFTVLTRCNDIGHARLGLTVARRAARRASDRNRIKRLARESFRHLVLAPGDFVVMARPPAAQADAATLRGSLDAHFLRLSGRSADCPEGGHA